MEAAAAARDLVSSRTGPQTIATSSSSSSAPLLPYNLPLLSAFLACALAQFLKLFTTWYKEKRWDSKRMLDSGGMPSSHSATVTALAVAVGLQEGSGSPAFAIVVVLACVVMYDASGVRLHAGRQAENTRYPVLDLCVNCLDILPFRPSCGNSVKKSGGAVVYCSAKIVGKQMHVMSQPNLDAV
ncbi:hypothetical protein SADUNF_Sadunf14G0118400 [Salix dunnii]|uniref:Acid phosphatase/vanadium-dependent haloperoxidase-related protein n=1 Tax=Salix dunnii TaxID=1413687 RepID=A0A835JJ17_9ROSI|nr:hypothetical protein SADUNF_Sadunf14G0118400 [Salix dunnii]